MVNYKDLLTINIKNLRKKSGLTQEKFAELVGLSVDGVHSIENGRYAPRPETIDKICKAFNITPFSLLVACDNQQDQDLIETINCKLKLCNSEELIRINQMIDLIKP